MRLMIKWKILVLIQLVVMLGTSVCGQSCKSLKISNCYDLYGNVKNYGDKAYPCFADGIETRYCRCKYADDSRQDMEAINSRMMCKSAKRFVGEEWFDKDTCQVKTCNMNEQVVILRGGCRKKTEERDPNKYCVEIGAPAFPCIYEEKFYPKCHCEKYDEENAIAKPVTCGSHQVGSSYVSNCNIVKCTSSGEEEILKRRCQKANGECVDNEEELFPCFIHGLLRGSCKCQDGCVQQKEKPYPYRVEIELLETPPGGRMFVALSGTVNETPIQELRFSNNIASATFTTEYVGIPRKLVMQLLGTRRSDGTDFKRIFVKDLGNQKEYLYNKSGQTGGSNGQWKWPHSYTTRNRYWLFPSVGLVYEGVCENKECEGRKPFGYHETYTLKFFCPFSDYLNGLMNLTRTQFVLSGEHLSTGLVDIENEHLLETMNTAPPMYPVFTSTYVLPYCGKITHFSLLFNASELVWKGTCTIRVQVKNRGQEYEFRYHEKKGTNKLMHKLTHTIECKGSPHCGKKDWDLVCEGENVAEWCKKDHCCSKKKLPCGRLCYVRGREYKGKWKTAENGEKCKTPCSNARTLGVPQCELPNGQVKNCNVPQCNYQKCFGGHCYLGFEKGEQRSYSKDFCFNEIGGRLAMIPEDNVYEVQKMFNELHGVSYDEFNPKIFWFEGLGIQRSPVYWYKNHDMVSSNFNGLFVTMDKDDLDSCIFLWNAQAFGGNCIRPGRPLCEVLME